MNVVRKLFGPSRGEIWRQLCDEIGADYSAGHIADGFWKDDRVQLSHGNWTITLDVDPVWAGQTTVFHTRLRAPYVNPEGFRFSVTRRDFLSGLRELMGMQDVIVGYEEFDHDFVIQGTDETKLRALFANARIRELLSLQTKTHFSVRDSEGRWGPRFPADTDELILISFGVIEDVERLKQFFDLFAETLDQLCRIGAAYEDAPELKL
jgi:hypothetical protein